MPGTLIVLDGADGAGKATQTRLLVDRLSAEGYVVHTLDFPQYTQNHFGRLLRECLDGKRGDFIATDPRIASTLYAADRYESSATIREWLESGAVVILDRYVSSNMLHQGAKIFDEEELSNFLTWLDAMEHGIFAIPRPDVIVYLDVPFAVRKKLKAEAVAAGKHGTEVKVDQAEANDQHQQDSEENAKRLVALHNEWRTVVCVDGETLLTREAIHEQVYETVKPILPPRYE
ncbi:MAG: deoxynucleoside kinase [Candidatus Pacebacteria bacterium]|jgi:dTMP kinase|nr:deoxynucleoside kinase [Candidatus Paceibacterota bacterium]